MIFLEQGKANDKRVLNISLSNSVLFDPPKCIRYLIHELFHFAAPYSREERNQTMGVIYFCQTYTEYWKAEMQSLIEDMIDNDWKWQQDRSGQEISKKYVLQLVAKAVNQWRNQKLFPIVATQYKKILSDIKSSLSSENEGPSVSEDNKSAQELFTSYCEILYQFSENLVTAQKHSNIEILGKERFYELKGFIKEAFRKAKNSPVDVKSLQQWADQLEYEEKRTCAVSCKEKYHQQYYMAEKALSENLVKPFREACADIAMIDLTGMDLAEYLIFFWSAKRDALEEISLLKQHGGDALRIGMCVDYIRSQKGMVSLSKESLYAIFNEADQKFAYRYLLEMWKESEYEHIRNDNCKNTDSDFAFFEKCADYISEAEKWFSMFRSLYDIFLSNFSIYMIGLQTYLKKNSLISRQNDFSSGDNVFLLTKFCYLNDLENGYAKQLLDYYNNISSGIEQAIPDRWEDSKKEYIKTSFDESLEILLYYQKQDTLEELKEAHDSGCYNRTVSNKLGIYTICKSQSPEKNRLFVSKRWEYTIDSSEVNSAFETLAYFAERLQEHTWKAIGSTSDRKMKKIDIWYRGQKNQEFLLVPSIMREYGDHKHFFPSLPEYQRALFEQFKAKADGSPEMSEYSSTGYTVSDYIALMQHYSVPTNFLDWSEDALSAMYFALAEIMFEGKSQTTDAAVYLFSPLLYNFYRSQMIGRLKDLTIDVGTYHRDSIKTALIHRNTIPNLSVKDNEKLYYMYLLGNSITGKNDLSSFQKAQTNNWKQEDLLCPYYPLAISTSRLNARIRVQSGIFTAFNLYAPMDPGEPNNSKKAYNYLAFEKIQKDFLISNPNDPPFLYKVTLKRDICGKLAVQLSNLGISTERIYPELNYVGLRIKNGLH